jgi:hypothetical protein
VESIKSVRLHGAGGESYDVNGQELEVMIVIVVLTVLA